MARYFKKILGGAILASALVAATAASGATTLRYAVGFPAGAGPDMAKVYAQAVDQLTDGKIKVKSYTLELLNLAEMSSGVAQGLADIGYVLGPYFPAEYPYLNMLVETSMLTALEGVENDKLGMAFAGAYAETVLFQCPECLQEAYRQNQVVTAVSASSNYIALCNRPIETLQELKGQRMRAGGAAWARWTTGMGASSVSMPGNEIFEALHQKIVACSMVSAPELSGLKLEEVVTHITDNMPGGIFSGTPLNINRDVWRKMSEDERSAMLRAGAIGSSTITYFYYEYAKRDIQKMLRENRATIHKADQELLDKSHEVIKQDIEKLAGDYVQKYKLDKDRATELIDHIRQAIPKWIRLVEPVDSADKLTELYWNEVFSKLDVKTYGM